MKLKTLKDLKNHNKGEFVPSYPDNTLRVDMVTKDELRAEAIKWIKELESYKSLLDSEGNKMSPLQRDIECQIRIDWIKHFFNITEED